MKKYDIYVSVFWLAMSLFICAVSALKFGLGALRSPGAGFFPFLVGLLLFFLSIGMIITTFKERSTKESFDQQLSFHRNAATTLIVLFAYAFSLEWLGYLIASFLLFVYLFKFPAGKKWGISILVSCLVVAIAYYLFGVLLKTQFPKGILKL